MRVGFIHGVMNTDNMTISGETIDYGPCAFMDEYNVKKVFSSIDYNGRYAFDNQADICFWNLMQFGKSLAHLIHPEPQKSFELVLELIDRCRVIYNQKYLKMMGKKIGILNLKEEDKKLIEELLIITQEASADYTLTFRYLCYAVDNAEWPFYSLFEPSEKLRTWIKRWHLRLQEQGISPKELSKFMFSSNPAIIPRNHQIEAIIEAAQRENFNFSSINPLLEALSSPYQDRDLIEYMRPPALHERVHYTFCGT